MMLYICTKFCESISKDFRVTDPKSRVAARVVAIYERHYHWSYSTCSMKKTYQVSQNISNGFKLIEQTQFAN